MKIIPFAGAVFIRMLHATLRIRHVRVANIEKTPQYIIAFWHQHLLLMLHSRYRRPVKVIISRSRDGEMIARVFDYYGVGSSRGSRTRGGSAALRELIRESRQGTNIVFTPDGPKGPARIAKEGVVWAARATGLPIIPIAFAAKKKSCCNPGIG
ncbi:MAG: lysophospholipid acyltransferase family protein [Thermoanaerobaculia bacterium]